jgi:hypothetical protein
MKYNLRERYKCVQFTVHDSRYADFRLQSIRRVTELYIAKRSFHDS